MAEKSKPAASVVQVEEVDDDDEDDVVQNVLPYLLPDDFERSHL
jgi:hypothetical protein